MKKFSVLMVMVLVLTLLTFQQGVGAAPPPQEGQYEPIVISCWSGPEYENLLKCAEAYTEKTGNEVIIEEIAREALREKTTTVLLAGAGDYDVSYVDVDWVPEFVQADTLASFNPFIEDAAVADPDLDLEAKEPGVSALTIEGQIYGYPSEGDTAWLFYRKDLLEEEGIEVPQTWDEFLEAAIKLTKDLDGDGKIDRYGAVSGARRDEAMWDFTHYFHGFGGQIIDEETWEVTVNNEKGLAALTLYADLLNKYQVVTPDVVTYGYNEILTSLQQDRAAMGVEWMAATQDLTSCDISPQVCDEEGNPLLGYTLIPGYLDEEGNVVRGQGGSQWGWVVPKGSQNQEAAYKFIEWLTSDEGAKMWALNGGIPSNTNALSDPEVVEQIPQFELLAEAMPYRHLFPKTVVTYDIKEAFAEAANAAVTGAKTPKEALDDAAAIMDEALIKAGYKESALLKASRKEADKDGCG